MRHLGLLIVASGFLVHCGGEFRPVPTGKLLYDQHCASCHGTDGQGDGPLASSLVVPPSDLTTIAARSGGTFDERRVMSVIDGEREVAEHGPREMPVWGVVFAKEVEGQRYAGYTVLLHGRALTDYVRSLQQK